MNLLAQYDALREAALPQLARGGAELDALLTSPHDARRGLTLLARPPAAITAAIGTLLAEFRHLEPAQYYYPASDLHLTILSIISCYAGFTLSHIDPEAYKAALRACVEAAQAFAITYSGLTASPAGIMVQGFPQGPGLENLRDTIRAHFREAGLAHTIDQRYRLQTAHSTVIRFSSPLANPGLLVAAIGQHAGQFIGTFEVNTVELVYNDWYQRAGHTVLLEKYYLPSPQPALRPG
jgi:2'-5' RNA ligase